MRLWSVDLSFSQKGRPPENGKKHRRLNFAPDVFMSGTIRYWVHRVHTRGTRKTNLIRGLSGGRSVPMVLYPQAARLRKSRSPTSRATSRTHHLDEAAQLCLVIIGTSIPPAGPRFLINTGPDSKDCWAVVTGVVPARYRLNSIANIRFVACSKSVSNLDLCMTDKKWRYNFKIVERSESPRETLGVMLRYSHGKLTEGTNRET